MPLPLRLKALVTSTALAIVFATGAVRAATYYVSQSAGNDANAGTSPGAPWKNAPGMSAYAGTGKLVPGDTVYFNSGDTWIVTGAQGLYLAGGATYVGNKWGAGTRAKLKAGADIASAVIRFSDDPKHPTVIQGFEVDAAGKVANGVEMNHSFYAGPLTGATKRVDDVVVHNVWSRSSLGQYKYGIIVSNFGGTSGEVANVEILNSVVYDISRDGIPIYPGDVNADCIVRNVVVRGNTVYSTGQDPDYGAGAGIIVKGRVIDAYIENNYVSATKGAGIFINGNETNHFGYGPTNIHIRYNLVNVDTVHGSIRIYDGSSGKDPKDVKIYGNIIYNNSKNAGLLLGQDVGNSNRLLVYNNTFFGNGVLIDSSPATFPVFEFNNNLIYTPNGTALVDSGKITSHVNNLYFGSGTIVRVVGKNYDASSVKIYEPTALAENPRFVDPANLPNGFTGTYGVNLVPNRNGLSVQMGSPAIDRGLSLISPYTGSINGVARPSGAGVDIGAYELGGSSPLAAPTNLRILP